MKTILDKQVLVLDAKTWEPINTKSVRRAITDVAKGVAEVLDGNETYDWELWTLMEPGIDEPTIHTSRQRFRIPEIIVLTNPQKGKRAKHRDLKMTRKNIFLRDMFECAYCGKHLTVSSGTLDHIHPKSRGGTNAWTNLVASCFKCNIAKKARTPKEAGFKLRIEPFKPVWYSFAPRLMGGIAESWVRWLDMTKVPPFCLKKHAAATENTNT
jgi:5-methylcytosine-specific restriction endonuclease McrA